MILKIYAIYDEVAEDVGVLMLHKNDAMAERSFRQAMKSVPENTNPEDFVLVRLGELVPELGTIPCIKPEKPFRVPVVAQREGI